MGKLAKLAGTEALKGQVVVTDQKGLTTVYDDEDAALKGIGDVKVEHRRGAFFVVEAETAKPPRAALAMEDDS